MKTNKKRKRRGHTKQAEIHLSPVQVLAVLDIMAWYLDEEIEENSPCFWKHTQEALIRRGIIENVHAVDEPPRLTPYGENFGPIAIEHFVQKFSTKQKSASR